MIAANTRPNPYVGPRAFQTGEKLYGRDREARELLDLLIAERIVLLHSPSGAGKSSLVQAGLIPRLKEEGFYMLPVVRVNLEPPSALKGLDSFLQSFRLNHRDACVKSNGLNRGLNDSVTPALRLICLCDDE